MPENALSEQEQELISVLHQMNNKQLHDFYNTCKLIYAKEKKHKLEGESKMNDLQLVKSEPFGAVNCDFYSDGKDYFMTREQIGQSLEYGNPKRAISDIHSRHKDRMDKFSVLRKLRTTDGKEYQTYLYTRKGIMEICRWSQQPGADAFMDWVWDIMDGLMSGNLEIKAKQPDLIKRELAAAKLNNSRARYASMWLKISQQVALPSYKQICASYASKALAGDMVIPLPASEEKHYKAGEIGKMFGVSANKIGRIANANGMKTEEYGGYYHDKSPNSPKEVDAFLYNAKAIDRFKELLMQ